MDLKLEDVVEDSYIALRNQLAGQLGGLWDDNEDKFKMLAYHVGLLQYRILRGERIDTAASALEDVLRVGVPMLAIELRYKVERAVHESVFSALSGFFSGVLSVAISAGRAYLEQESLSMLAQIGEGVYKWH